MNLVSSTANLAFRLSQWAVAEYAIILISVVDIHLKIKFNALFFGYCLAKGISQCINSIYTNSII